MLKKGVLRVRYGIYRPFVHRVTSCTPGCIQLPSSPIEAIGFNGSSTTAHLNAMNAFAIFRSLLIVSTFALVFWACDFGFGKAESNGADVAIPTTDSGTTYTEESGLPEDRIYAVASCPNGNVWLGYGDQADGLTRYNGSNWKTFTEQENGLEDDAIYALACDQNNGVWIGYGIQGQGVTRYTGDEWKTFTEQDGLSSNYVATITSEKDGELWIGYDEQQEGVDHFK